MAVVVVFEGVTEDQYEEAVRRLTGGKDRFQSVSDWPVPGLHAHAAGQAADTFRIVDVWESEEAFGRFADTLGPILQEIGVDSQPEIYPAHTFVSA